MKKKVIIKNVFSIILIVIGCALAAFSIGAILIPNLILDGGINGISIMLGQLTGIKTSLFIVILNIPFLLLGYKTLGKEFVFKALFAMLTFSAILYFTEPLDIHIQDKLLATIYGGLVLGFGVGLVIRYGGCLDGTEIAAIILSKKTNFSVGQIVLICNVFIYGVAGFMFGFDRALYSLLTYFITFKVIDFVSEGLEQGKAALIITNQSAKVARDIYEKLGRTVTSFEGKGMINGETMILYCVITRLELTELRNIVNADDVQAFVTVIDVSEIIGAHIKKKPEIG
ncbi:MAG: YitT family protein [Clostridia bacterium]